MTVGIEKFGSLSAKVLEPRELTLTCKGMSFVNLDRGDDDFEFVFCDEKVIRVHSVLAEFVSPKISRLRRFDPFYNDYVFKNDIPGMFEALELLIQSLQSGHAFLVEPSNIAGLVHISQELENSELLSSLLGMAQAESLSLEEAILLLPRGIDLWTVFSPGLGNLRDFIASHFYEIDKEILDNLDLETAQLLLLSPSLRIKDEDSLYDFVRSRSESDLRFASLFEFVYFESVSADRLEDFASFANENLLENISSGIWTRICSRLILGTKLKKGSHTATPPRIELGTKFECAYEASKPLDGIIAHLTRECGGNVHDRGVVNVTANKVYDDNSYYHPKGVADLESDSIYFSDDGNVPWICYDFKGRRVIPKSYTLRSYDNAPGGFHPRSWDIEVSNDGISWTIVDRRSTNELNNRYVTRNFEISHVPSDGFRFIRLRISAVIGGSSNLKLVGFEIFGTIFGE